MLRKRRRRSISGRALFRRRLRREVNPTFAGIEADEVHVEAIQRAPEDDQGGGYKKPARGAAVPVTEENERSEAEQGELAQEAAGVQVESPDRCQLSPPSEVADGYHQ